MSTSDAAANSVIRPHVPVVPDADPARPRSRWHARYEKAGERYTAMDFSAELLDALAAGLREWASILPQVEVNRHGQHKKANSWGLAAELTALWRLEIMLDLDGDARLCDQIKRMSLHLHKSAETLDGCYPKVSADEEEAERRLVLTCRIVAHALADLLGRMKHRLFGVKPKANPWPDYKPTASQSRQMKHQPAPTKKRASRATGIETLKLELIEHIKAAKDHAHVALEMDREPELLPRPSMADLGRRAGLPRHGVSRCFADPAAQELRLLWQMAGDLDSILRYSK